MYMYNSGVYMCRYAMSINNHVKHFKIHIIRYILLPKLT